MNSRKSLQSLVWAWALTFILAFGMAASAQAHTKHKTKHHKGERQEQSLRKHKKKSASGHSVKAAKAEKTSTHHGKASSKKRAAQEKQARLSAAAARHHRLSKRREMRRAQLALAGSGQELGSDDEQSAVATAASRGAVRRVAESSSVGRQEGLQAMADPLHLSSGAVLVIDSKSGDVLYRKNENAVLPIASISKLMTAVVLTEAKLPMDEAITITEADVDHLRNSASRLRVGTTLSRGQMLLLALMSSENRAAHSLARTFPGGEYNFVRYMNQKARDLGMRSTHYVEPTGLSSENQSTAHDLAILVGYAAKDVTLRSYTTSPEYAFDSNGRQMQYHNSNSLVRGGQWEIELQKTGYIREAGRCMVMKTQLGARNVVMVLLDSASPSGRVGDAEHIRKWLESGGAAAYARNEKASDLASSSLASRPQGNLMQAMRGD